MMRLLIALGVIAAKIRGEFTPQITPTKVCAPDVPEFIYDAEVSRWGDQDIIYEKSTPMSKLCFPESPPDDCTPVCLQDDIPPEICSKIQRSAYVEAQQGANDFGKDITCIIGVEEGGRSIPEPQYKFTASPNNHFRQGMDSQIYDQEQQDIYCFQHQGENLEVFPSQLGEPIGKCEYGEVSRRTGAYTIFARFSKERKCENGAFKKGDISPSSPSLGG
jgi:hypothetical protein